MKRILFLLLFAATPVVAQPAHPYLGDQQAVRDGKAIYDRVCTACHGPDGTAGERAPAIVLANAGTALRGQRSIAEIEGIVRNGIPGTAMPAWGTRLSDQDILKLGAYIQGLRGVAIDNPLPGDVARGEQIFWGQGGCGACHMINGRGGVTGPDLTNIAGTRKAAAIVSALTEAEHVVFSDGGVHLPALPPMNYQPVQVVTKDGRTIDGVMRNQDHWSVQFIGMDGSYHSLARANLASVTVKPGSIMPTDYDKRLSPADFRDLLAFLTRQGHKPGPGK